VIEAYEKTVDPEIFAEMGEMGLLGVTVPEEYGGAGAAMSPTAWWRARSSASTAATAR
jgi:alkylation response protein AidB-like acyl-CoA dehydrogenase